MREPTELFVAIVRRRGGTEPALYRLPDVSAGGGVRLGCGFRQPNSGTVFGASVMVTPPYKGLREPSRPRYRGPKKRRRASPAKLYSLLAAVR